MASLRRYDGEKEKTHILYDYMMNYYLRNEEKTKAFGTILKLVAGSLLKLSVSATHSSLGHVYIGRWVDTTILKKPLNEKNKRGTKLEMDVAIHTLTIQKAEEIRPKQFSQSAAVIDSKVHFTASSRNQPRS